MRVPQTRARSIRPDLTAELTIPEMPGQVFKAKVVTTTETMSATSRTLLTELELDNLDDQILTAAAYGLGHSEEIVARALAEIEADLRAAAELITVCGDRAGVRAMAVLNCPPPAKRAVNHYRISPISPFQSLCH